MIVAARTSRALAAIAASGLLIASCGGSSDDAAPAPATEAPAEAVADTGEEATVDGEDSAAVPAALRFTAPLVGGGEIDATTLADKPTVFWFWAPT